MLKINKVLPRVFEGFKVFAGLGIRKTVRLLLLPTLVLASLPALNAATLNVLDYGAVINDGLNDSTAINSALAAASAGDEVYFPNGTYNIFTLLTVPANVSVRGESENGVILVSNTTTSGDKVFYSSPCNNVQIQRLTIEGNSNPYLSIGIYFSNGQNASIHHVKIQNMTTDLVPSATPAAIMFGGYMTNSSITNNTILNIGVADEWGTGIRVWEYCTYNRIAFNYIQDTGRGGILFVNYCTNNTVEYNTVRGSGRAFDSNGVGLSIEMNTGCNSALVQYNDVDHWISLENNNYAVRGNTVSDTSTWKPWGLESGGNDFVFARNRVLSGSKVGVLTGADLRALYRDNEIRRCNTWGMHINSAHQDCFYRNIFANTVTDTQSLYPGQGDAIEFHYDVGKILFKKNQLINNQWKGIDGYDSLTDRVSFVGNTIADNGGVSISIPFPGSYVEWTDNLVYGNGTNNILENRGGWNLNVPNANFTYPATIQVNTAVQFTDTSTDPDGTIVERLWDFDAGIPSTATNPTFTYDRWGRYTPTLVVWDNDGKASVIDKNITVLPDSKDLLLLDLDETDTTVPITDQSEDNNTISRYGTLTIVPGIRNNCLNFSTGALLVSGPVTGKMNNSFRMAAWVKLNAMPSWRNCIFSKETYLTNGFRAGIDGSGRVCFWTTQSGGTLDISSAAGLVQTGVWYYVEYVYANGQSNIYLNKTLAASGTGTYIPNNNTTLRMGYDADPVNGYIDEIEASSLSLLDLNLNEGSGVPADASEDHNTMVLAVGTTWDPNGYQGSCLWMDSGGLYTSGPVVNQIKDPFRMAARVKLNAMPSWRNCVFSQEAYMASGFRAGIDSSGKVCFWTTQSGGTLDISSAAGLLQTGVWYLVEFVYENGKGSIYLNNTLVASGTGTYVPNNSVFRMGYESEYLKGWLDDIKVDKLR